jgi:phosphoribosylaminoimidazolecarboxamide formyltransferase/IMP cyclohydrolase
MPKTQRALLSVHDKTGLVPFAQALAEARIELVSTGGTARVLRAAGLAVRELSDYTGFPEMLDGRVKTLHPRVHGGLLFVRDNPEHEAAARAHDIPPIDLVVVNLYPFEQTIARPDCTLPEAIEQIDIGGPAMLRSAAKNHAGVTVVTDPADYATVADQIRERGATTLELRQQLAAKVFARTAAYDAAIATHLTRAFGADTAFPPAELSLRAPRASILRYGENPHQRAAVYGAFPRHFEQLHGKELSYNNILDLTAAAALIAEFRQDPPTVAILKHTNPCGVGQGASLNEAWNKALATDSQAPFGGIIAVNRALDRACAEAIAGIFSEVIVAPEFDPGALEVLRQRKNLRLLRHHSTAPTTQAAELRSVGYDSWLVQERDQAVVSSEDLRVVTKRAPTPSEINAMLFGWRIVKHVKSNAIVYVAQDRTLGIGAGQMSRVDASRIAVWKAGAAGLALQGSVVCSDAFFPFADGLMAAAAAGATAAIQPGGSVRDAEVIAAADERGMAMAFTGLRHFRH